MKKKIYRLLPLALVLLVILPLLSGSASAAGLMKRNYVSDDAGALSTAEINSLNESAREVSEQYACSVTVFYTTALNGRNVQSFADDYFDLNDMGYGMTEDGILLLVDTEERAYQISTSGYGIDAFTDAGIRRIEDKVLPCLGRNDWNGAAEQFISSCGSLLRQARNGHPYDVSTTGSSSPLQRFNAPLLGLTGFLGALFGGLPLSKQKKALQTVKKQQNATQYIYGQNPVLTKRIDRYLTSNVVRVRKAENNSSSGSSGGGSSVHISSSGHTHGGHGGHF